jgi:hypothetical protein
MIKRFDYYEINPKAIDMLAAIDKHPCACAIACLPNQRMRLLR